MARVVLLSRDPAHAKQLEAAGHQVRCWNKPDAELLRRLLADPPEVVVIDLSRAPSMGRDIALAIRNRKSTRHVPFVFFDGEDVGQLRALLPGETYCRWEEVERAIGAARPVLGGAPAPPVLAGYAGSPLEKKLGIKPGDTVALTGEPEDFRERMPEGVHWRLRPDKKCSLAIWFVRSAAELESELAWIARAGAPRLWIAWPKGGKAAGLTQATIRKTGLAEGLVDYKICSIDKTWSALLFTWR